MALTKNWQPIAHNVYSNDYLVWEYVQPYKHAEIARARDNGEILTCLTRQNEVLTMLARWAPAPVKNNLK